MAGRRGSDGPGAEGPSHARRLKATLAGGWNDAVPVARRALAPLRRTLSRLLRRLR